MLLSDLFTLNHLKRRMCGNMNKQKLFEVMFKKLLLLTDFYKVFKPENIFHIKITIIENKGLIQLKHRISPLFRRKFFYSCR
jgi:hypothetical protein